MEIHRTVDLGSVRGQRIFTIAVDVDQTGADQYPIDVRAGEIG
jgi:hypothetical protein